MTEKFGNGILTVTIDGLDKISDLANAAGLSDGSAQKFFTQEVARATDEYVPMQTGVLAGTAMRFIEPNAIHYIAPYAGYLYEGKMMVDPVYMIGGFHNKKTGRWWSRKGVQKIVDPRGRKLKYDKTAHPKAGDHWAERAWTDHGKEITSELVEFIENRLEEKMK